MSIDEKDGRRLNGGCSGPVWVHWVHWSCRRLELAGKRGKNSDNDHRRWYPDSLSVRIHRKIAWRAGPVASRCS